MTSRSVVPTFRVPRNPESWRKTDLHHANPTVSAAIGRSHWLDQVKVQAWFALFWPCCPALPSSKGWSPAHAAPAQLPFPLSRLARLTVTSSPSYLLIPLQSVTLFPPPKSNNFDSHNWGHTFLTSGHFGPIHIHHASNRFQRLRRLTNIALIPSASSVLCSFTIRSYFSISIIRAHHACPHPRFHLQPTATACANLHTTTIIQEAWTRRSISQWSLTR